MELFWIFEDVILFLVYFEENYLFEPFIYHVFNKKINFEEREINPGLIEAVAISNLSRLSYEGISSHVYYWKNKKEVDLLLMPKNQIFPFEIKYQTRIQKEDYRGLYYFNKGILITKDLLDIGEKYSAIPIHLILAII